MDDRLVMQVRNDIQTLDDSRVLMRGFLEQRGVQPGVLYKCELVFEEALTNTIRYGFDDAAAHTIDVTVSIDREEVVLEFDDDGRPFDLVAAEAPTRASAIERATPGGLGILLLRRSAKKIAYDRVHHRNRTTVTIARE